MNDIIIPFIPTIDEKDGRLIYIAEPFLDLEYYHKVIIIMPFEFSISLEDEEPNSHANPSKIIMLTFWDLLETFSVLNTSSNFVIFHNSDLDEIGKQLESFSNQLWGASADDVLDTINISRQIFSWMKKHLDKTEIRPKLFHMELFRECLAFHKRNGIVGIDENDEIERPFFERALLARRQAHQNKKKIQASISGVSDLLEKEAYKKATLFWERYSEEGKILYYPPGKFPII